MKFLLFAVLAIICLTQLSQAREMNDTNTEIDAVAPNFHKMLTRLGVITDNADQCEIGLMSRAELILLASLESGSKCPFDESFSKCVTLVLDGVRANITALDISGRICPDYVNDDVLPVIFKGMDTALGHGYPYMIKIFLDFLLDLE